MHAALGFKRAGRQCEFRAENSQRPWISIFKGTQNYSIWIIQTTGLPLGGEESIEVCALGVFRCVLRGKDISQNVVALAAGFVLAHQLGLEESGPSLLQSLHPSNVGLQQRQQIRLTKFIRQLVSKSIYWKKKKALVTLQTRATLGVLTLV